MFIEIDFVFRIDSNLKLTFVHFNFKCDFYIQIYHLFYFYLNLFKYKSFYIQLIFNLNQFYKINHSKINFIVAKPNTQIKKSMALKSNIQ